MGRRQRRRAQINTDILIINKINLRSSAHSASSASGNVNLTHLHLPFRKGFPFFQITSSCVIYQVFPLSLFP